jgi:photosystem II stability/assembly factor-like uncharacterized protein
MNFRTATLPTSGGFTMIGSRLIPAMAAVLLILSLPAAAAKQADSKKADSKKVDSKKADAKAADTKVDNFKGLAFRGIGPAMISGRITDIAVDPRNNAIRYVTAASGNVWKTINAGTTWTPIFDGEGSYSIGCVTLDPKNPLTVWIGTGENNSQRSVAYGNGVYRSMDGGVSWDNLGLKNSEHIAKILIDPRDSNRVLVAAQGPLWAPGGDRGLYETLDGGKTWKAILTVDENTGVTDVVRDPRTPSNALMALSLSDRAQDEFLGPSEIGGWNVDAALVVLSGCSSGAAVALPGAGLMGMTRAWLMAGAGAVVATLWPTPDDVGVFFRRFYHDLQRTASRNPAGALRALVSTGRPKILMKPSAAD